MRDNDGTKNKTRLPTPAIFSAIFSAVNVLPVPHAIISLPRSAYSKPSCTAFNAATWCGLSDFLVFSCTGLLGVYTLQSIALFSNSDKPMRCTGFDCPSKAASAFLLHSLRVVSKIKRLVNSFLPDAVKNESISPFCIR